MKVRFTFLWIIFLGLAYFSHGIKTYLIIFAMLFIHECGHIIVAKKLGLKVDEIVIYPFGFGAMIHHLDHVTTMQTVLVLVCGLITHFIFPLIIRLTQTFHLISSAYCEYLIQLNWAILFFNCLPIYPLDGGRLLDAYLHLFFSYPLARKITLITSLFFYLLILCFMQWNMMILLVFVGIQLLTAIFDQAQDRLHFYFYRFLHPLKTTHKIRNELHRNYSVILRRQKNDIQEQRWLKEMFSK